MKTNQRHWPYATILFVLLQLICCCSAKVFAQQKLPLAINGIIDLRNQSLSTTPASLTGDWAFYWQQLITADSPSLAGRQFAAYPQLWKNIAKNGQALPSQGYASYALTVLLPKNHTPLALEIPDAYSAYTLFANGQKIASNGVTGSNANNSSPFWATSVVPLALTSDTLHLVMQVSNFWHAKGGAYKEIFIGNKDQLTLKYRQETALDLVLAGCLFMGGLFFWGLSVFGRNDKIIFYFSVFCIVTSYRMIGTDLYVLHSLFPQLNWFIAIRLEYLSLVLGVALFSQYTRLLYRKDTID
ncbi:MAG TPA: hypothetical protein VL307_17780, partial [Chitinophagaceae bacterium]|nr:hypothetical protein [Chitinophagaceae bacterium]